MLESTTSCLNFLRPFSVPKLIISDSIETQSVLARIEALVNEVKENSVSKADLCKVEESLVGEFT